MHILIHIYIYLFIYIFIKLWILYSMVKYVKIQFLYTRPIYIHNVPRILYFLLQYIGNFLLY